MNRVCVLKMILGEHVGTSVGLVIALKARNEAVIAPDGRRIASASDDKAVKVWDARPVDP